MSEPRYTETWADAFMTTPGLPVATGRVAHVMSRRANWRTGADCWPSVATIAKATALSRETVKRCLAAMEVAGWIVRTGVVRPNNTTDYLLVIPEVEDVAGPRMRTSDGSRRARLENLGSLNPDPTGLLNPDPTEAARLAHSEASVSSIQGVGWLNPDPQSLLPPHDHEGVREGGGSSASPPRAGARSARPEDVADMLAGIVPAHLAHLVNIADPALADILADWASAGRTREHLAATLAKIGTPKHDYAATAFLVTHIRTALSQDVPIFDPGRLAAPAPVGQSSASEPAGAGSTSPKARATSKPRATREPKAEPPGRLALLTKFCGNRAEKATALDTALGAALEVSQTPTGSVRAEVRGRTWAVSRFVGGVLVVDYWGENFDGWRQALPAHEEPRSRTEGGWTAHMTKRTSDAFVEVAQAMTKWSPPR
jgi:hypothetical protein